MTQSAKDTSLVHGDESLVTLAALARLLPWIVAGFSVLGALAAMSGTTLQQSALGRSLIACFHLDQESSIASWFSSSILLLCAFVMGHVGRQKRAVGHRDAGAWLALALGHGMLSMDETVGLHERLGNAVARALPVGTLGTFAWVIPGAAIIGLGALLFGRFLWRQEPELRRRLIVACTCYFGGALGCEAIGAWIYTRSGKESWLYAAGVVCEESLEMLGAVLLLRAMLMAADAARTPQARAAVEDYAAQGASAEPVAEKIVRHNHTRCFSTAGPDQ